MPCPLAGSNLRHLDFPIVSDLLRMSRRLGFGFRVSNLLRGLTRMVAAVELPAEVLQ